MVTILHYYFFLSNFLIIALTFEFLQQPKFREVSHPDFPYVRPPCSQNGWEKLTTELTRVSIRIHRNIFKSKKNLISGAFFCSGKWNFTLSFVRIRARPLFVNFSFCQYAVVFYPKDAPVVSQNIPILGPFVSS